MSLLTTSRVFISLLLFICSNFISVNVSAETYPVRPIRILVGALPSSTADICARIVAQRLTEIWGQTVIVENRPGGGGIVALRVLDGALADGYTLILVPASGTSRPAVSTLYSDPSKQMAGVARLASAPLVLVMPATSGVKTVAELISLAKSKPDKLNYGSPGVGSVQHFVTELFSGVSGIRMTHIPYKGGPLAVTGLITGEIQLFFAGAPAAGPFLKQGRLNALAVTTKNRTQLAPGVPTMEEAGLKGFEVDNWSGLSGPAKTPRTIVEKINADLRITLQSQDIKDKLFFSGADANWSTADEFQKLVSTETLRWAKVARESNMKRE